VPETQSKSSYVGAPAIFLLELACRQINEAFGNPKSCANCYLVGSAIERADWRDVDVRFIMPDEEFSALFPGVHLDNALWEYHPRWLLLTSSISKYLQQYTGLPIDFQFQPQTFANKRHDKNRHAIGMKIIESSSVTTV